MTGKYFIKAAEVWAPMPDRNRLILKRGYYGELEYFKRVSRGMQFAFDEGLPGKCWARGTPVMLSDLNNSFFKRSDAANLAGLSCAVAIPHFVGADLAGVTTLFCSNNQEHIGALEFWHAAEKETDLVLVDGYFGGAKNFEFSSSQTTFAKQVGLPGTVWESGLPLIIEDIVSSETFQRKDKATHYGLNRGFGFPCSSRGAGDWVMTFLSAPHSPIARRVELWTPNYSSGCFQFNGGYCESGTDLALLYKSSNKPLDVGIMGEARITGMATISSEQPEQQIAELVLPIFKQDGFQALLVLAF